MQNENSRTQAATTKPVAPCTCLTHLTFLTLLTLAATGCQVLTYTAPTGEHFTRSSLGAYTSISTLTLECTTNGVRRVELRGYKNDTTQALGVITAAAVSAAIRSAK